MNHSIAKVYASNQEHDLPELTGQRVLSYFEFWPAWLFYAPVKLYALWLACRYGGLTVPTVANPLFDVGGLVGESKSQILHQVGQRTRHLYARHILAEKQTHHPQDITALMQHTLAQLNQAGISFPLVAKPNLGMRGMGVQCVLNEADLQTYLTKFPEHAGIMLQELCDYPAEAGLFYIREPGAAKGQIISLTLKYFPYVIGNGTLTLRQLIAHDPRAGKIAHLYLPRHHDRLDWIVPAGQKYRLAFAGSHSRGTIFKNGAAYITPEMTAAWQAIADDIPEFYFGRFDIRFKNLIDLQNARDLKIVEVNGAGAESTHIWDAETSLREAYSALFKQYRALFRIGAMNKRRGFQPLRLRDLRQKIKLQNALAATYPLTH